MDCDLIVLLDNDYQIKSDNTSSTQTFPETCDLFSTCKWFMIRMIVAMMTKKRETCWKKKDMIPSVANLQVASFPFHHFTTMHLLLSTLIILPIITSNNLWFKEILFMKSSSWRQGILGFLEYETPCQVERGHVAVAHTVECYQGPPCDWKGKEWLKGQRFVFV